MQKHTVVAIVIFLLLVIAGVIYKVMQPSIQKQQAYATSDARGMKGEIKIALDSWIGYFPIQSPVFRKLMREDGYRVVILDDGADYPGRMADLKSGEIDLAVCTVDAYLVNGAAEGFPGTIITVIDESKGGDAIVAWKNKIDSIDKLKDTQNFKIAFTPDSPSHHLLKSVGVHFGIDELLNSSGNWKIETSGAQEAYRKFMSKEVEIAVIWEPYVTKALSNSGVVKLLGTEDVEKLIVDILLVSRNYASKNPELVELVVKNYYQTMKIYTEQPELLQNDIIAHTKLNEAQVQSMLQGVKWLDLFENARWFGLDAQRAFYQEELLASIEATVKILIENRDFQNDPLPNQDPLTIIDSSFLEKVYVSGVFGTEQASYENPLERKFPLLKDSQWEILSVVGSLKFRNVTFLSGTFDLDYNGQEQLDASIEILKHYPNFRIVVKGHTGTRGDPEANKALSQQRANSAKEYFVQTYNMDLNRIRAIGAGGSEPLKKRDGESSRSYNDRLKRVEVYIVSP